MSSIVNPKTDIRADVDFKAKVSLSHEGLEENEKEKREKS